MRIKIGKLVIEIKRIPKWSDWVFWGHDKDFNVYYFSFFWFGFCYYPDGDTEI